MGLVELGCPGGAGDLLGLEGAGGTGGAGGNAGVVELWAR